jgi:acyl-CoA dehydrogenase
MEDTGVARLLRDAQVLPIWEGTTNVLSLDVFRVLGKPGVAEAYLSELERLASPRLAEVRRLLGRLPGHDAEAVQRSGRRLAFLLAEAWISGLLQEAATHGERERALADSWLNSEPRLDGLDRFDLLVDGAGTSALPR